ncbi:uncharacterized protein LOC115623625 [Scaptodrosophila lebanonensis]|uniref:Uncharacterized protein LOC115623625 n=1 Tax=Drosophila lebanonensis TaxID=7225 RepID=A0A6J2TD53_DROLE|nr:uncharacterized protein LOC115623625 [Scaptodrosophila lebanonensis]
MEKKMLSKPPDVGESPINIHRQLNTYIQEQRNIGNNIVDLDCVFEKLIDDNRKNEEILNQVLHCLYRILQNYSSIKWSIGPKVFLIIKSLITVDGPTRNRQELANILECISMYIQIHIHVYTYIHDIWSCCFKPSHKPIMGQLVVQLWEHFYNLSCIGKYSNLPKLLQILLQSDVQDDRLAAYCLMKKLLPFECNIMLSKYRDHPQWRKHCTDYINVMEKLEMQDLDKVPRTLQIILPCIMDERIDYHKLFVNLLSDESNILVLRCTLEFIISYLTMAKLNEFNVLHQFLMATNKTSLYDREAYILPEVQIERFLTKNECSVFLEALAELSWEPVPLHYWLDKLKNYRVKTIDTRALLKISTCVYNIENDILRTRTREHLLKICEEVSENLSLEEYLRFIENLYHAHEYYDTHLLASKVETCIRKNHEIPELSKRCYEVINDDLIQYPTVVYTLLKYFEKKPVANLGWWRFLFTFRVNFYSSNKLNKTCCNFIRNAYGLDIKLLLRNCGDVHKLQQDVVSKLRCVSEEEKLFVQQSTVDLLVTNTPLDALPLKPLELLSMGGPITFANLARYMRMIQPHFCDHNFMAKFNEHLKSYYPTNCIPHRMFQPVANLVHWYIENHNDQMEIKKLIQDFNQTNLRNYIFRNISQIKPSVEELLFSVPTTKSSRIEDSFILTERSIYDRDAYVGEFSDVNNLLSMNNELSEKKTPYTEYSETHRTKIRIIRSIWKLANSLNYNIKVDQLDQWWTALFEPNDLHNVKNMYECLVGNLMINVKPLWDRLRATSDSKQQLSLISVIHIYYSRSICFADLMDVIILLRELTKDAIYQVRLFAQEVIDKLMKNTKHFSEDLKSKAKALWMKEEHRLDATQLDFENKIRLLLPELNPYFTRVDWLLYVTNAPFDEYDGRFLRDSHMGDWRKKLDMLRDEFNAISTKPAYICDIYPVCNFKNELIVVASFPNQYSSLDGLVRTCEVFRVQTLVIFFNEADENCTSSKPSLEIGSILNIIEMKKDGLSEYLLEKRAEGYKIVSNEHSIDSTGLLGFKFPRKCVLQLGYKNHGIIVDGVKISDYAVGISQCEEISALNMNERGSLFIWEYCRQHIPAL